jgi:glycosyltransferase involved in cell wall biosynthesis
VVRILHVVASVAPRYGGAARVVQDQCRSLANRGHRVELFTTTQGGFSTTSAQVDASVTQDGYTITYYGWTGSTVFPVSPGLLRALIHRVGEFDLVHVHGLYVFATLGACALARRRTIPYVVEPHGTLCRHSRRRHRLRKAVYGALIERRNLDGAYAIVYASAKEEHEADGTRTKALSRVVPNGINVEDFRHPSKDVDFPTSIPLDLPLLTFVGRIAPVKALDILVPAAARVIGSGHRIRLVLAGPDSDHMQARLEKQAADLGIGGFVTFPGWIEGASKVALLQRSTVFVMPSYQESFGIAVVEALAAGVPVVVSRGVGICTDIQSAHAGVVAEPTIDGISQAIIRLMENESDRRSMASAGSSLAGQFSVQAMGERLETLYAQAIGSGQPRK